MGEGRNAVTPLARGSQSDRRMTPAQFRTRRVAMRLSDSAFAAYLGITSSAVRRCERDLAPHADPFVLDLVIAYVELQVEAATVQARARSMRLWPISRRGARPPADM